MTALPYRSLSVRLTESIRHYYDLGFISFGGPGVHVVILRKRFVDQLSWLDSTTFSDLFSLGNALPGPGSTQLAFSIAVARNGSLCGLLAFFLWSLPGALAMAGLGVGVRSIPESLPRIVYALLTGLNAAAVGLIAVAAYQLSINAVTDSMTRLIVLGSAGIGICYHAPWVYPVLVATGGILTLSYDYRLLILKTAKSLFKSLTSSSNKKLRPRQETLDAQTAGANEEISLNYVGHDGTRAVSVDAIEMQVLQRGQEADITEQGAKGTSLRGSGEDKRDGQMKEMQEDNTLRQRSTAQSSQPIPATTTPVTPAPPEPIHTHIMTPPVGIAVACGALFFVLVVTVVVLNSRLQNSPRAFEFFGNMMIAGTIIFGGGPVVIPLLRGYTVSNGWVTSRDFLLGFAILNAMPGPNFNFAVFLGALSVPSNPALGALLGYIGIFTPGVVLKLSLLPVYNKWRKYGWARSGLRGLNAAAAGLVWTAVYALFLVGYIYTPADGADGTSTSASLTSDPFWATVSACAFVASLNFSVQPFISIAGGALAGMAWYGVTRR